MLLWFEEHQQSLYFINKKFLTDSTFLGMLSFNMCPSKKNCKKMELHWMISMLPSTSEGTLSVSFPGILFFRLILVKAVTTYFR